MQRFFNSSLGVSIALAIGRLIPLKLGYRLAAFLGRLLAKRKNSPMVEAIRANQQFILEKTTSRGTSVPPEAVDQAVEAVYQHAGRCLVDLYHHMQDPEGLKALCPLTEDLQRMIEWSQDDSFGAFVVAPHLSNFDLVFFAAAYYGVKGQLLTFNNPTGGYPIQNNLRAQTGLNITPISPQANRQAIRNMRKGGFVFTGVDRPLEKSNYLRFFGGLSPMPVGHIRMALIARVPIIVAAVEWKEDGCYYTHVSDPIPLVRHDDPDQEIRINAEAILARFEALIRRNPTQWLMYYPVWPAEIQPGIRQPGSAAA